MKVEIDRAGTSAEWDEMRAICVETAARPVPAGESGAFGRRWIDPYERWAREWAYVARADGRVVGYLTGCASTAAFLAKTSLFGPRVPLGANARFPKALLLRLLLDFPAHLHVNVREGFRGGTGRALVERYESDLRKAGVRGLHLFCGERPLGFYLKTGFAELGRLRHGDVSIYAVGKKL